MPKPTYHLYLVTLVIPVFFREVKIFGKVILGVLVQTPPRWRGGGIPSIVTNLLLVTHRKSKSCIKSTYDATC